MRFRTSSLLAIATTLAVAAPPAFAQDTTPTAEPQAEPAAPAEDTQIVVTGTRAQGRSRLDTASPVDVLSGTALRNQGTTELGAALSTVAPSIDFPRPSAVDGTDAIRPATLRGLSPDQTLVLINGVRANASALLNINGSVGRGSAAVDLNTIPATALERIEVLRDGASAQYGSDAIAGVINVRLREARSGGGVTATYGFYATDIDTARGSRSVTGEPTFTASAWQGLGFGNDGYVTLSGEYTKREPTNRADFDPRVTPTRVTGRFGDPEVEQYTGYINAGTGIGDNWKLYGWFGYQDRDSRSAAFPRLASAATAVSGIYPNGFLPIINTKSTNANGALGLKGDLAGWNVDLNVAYGRNKIAYYTRNSANYAYGNASPTNFYDGALIYDQWVAGLDVSRSFDVFQSLNVAFGVEGRREGFKITPGEQASYGYPTGVTTGTPGAQGFGGFSPANAIERGRKNVSGYIDLEAQVTDKFLVGLAGRAEHYTDFGDTGTGKVSLRYDVTPWFALRGTASTGFRAPSLQQQYFTSVASVIQNGNPILTGTFPSVSPVATALGGLPLEPERSTNLSLGTVIRSGGFDLTVDAYQIRLRNQLALSENIASSFSPQVATLLAPYNVSAARFFINGLRSRVRGVDVVAHYKLRADDAGTFDFTLAGNFNQTKLDRSSIPTSTGAINPAPTLFARSRIYSIEQGTPGEKLTGTIDWSLDKLAITARASYYGNVIQPGTTPAADIYTGKHTIADLELRYQALKGAQFALGVNNLFDEYPDYTIAANNSTGVVGFPYYSPFGFGGRYIYARIGLSW
ncbi:TonB-dependent receptor plug domain-containing protein [Sphingomonas sp. OTU376]|uniref:TonB-dependent receptor plug domain-containing protein n=1 Tax=Sphingomonas sp. OTU376 TaxID=3043863 RepID=UPI00313D37E7